MSIAPNVGAISRYLGQVQRNPIYNRLRSKIGSVVDELPGPLSVLGQVVRRWEESMKSFLTPGVLFEELGFRYFGPIDGHDIDVLVDTFTAVKGMRTPRLVHVITKKGKGFPAGEHHEKWHALPAGHDPSTGKQKKAAAAANPAYTAVFGKGLTELGDAGHVGRRDHRRDAGGTGTSVVRRGASRIASSTSASPRDTRSRSPPGSRRAAFSPVVAIYSTFLQRAYDNVIHDVALQHLPVVFCMDRAGLVGEDGPTHMGLYDIAYMLAVPGMVVTAPKNGTEMLALLRTALAHTAGPLCLRYPRDASPDVPPAATDIPAVPFGTWEVLRQGQDIAILAVGTMVLPALAAAEALAADGIDPTVVNCRFLKPFDEITLTAVVGQHPARAGGRGRNDRERIRRVHGTVDRADRSGGARGRARRARSLHRAGAAEGAARARRGSTRRASRVACARYSRAKRSPGDPPRRHRQPELRRAAGGSRAAHRARASLCRSRRCSSRSCTTSSAGPSC